MNGLWKWIGLIIGLSIPGRFWGIIGFFIGAAVDAWDGSFAFFGSPENEFRSGRHALTDHQINLMHLTSAVLRADGRVGEGEVRFIRHHLSQRYGRASTRRMEALLLRLMQHRPMHREAADDLRSETGRTGKRGLLEFLRDVALADGALNRAERDVLEQIARSLGMVRADFQAVMGGSAARGRRPSSDPLEEAYRTLGVPVGASEERVRKAYRTLVLKNHPDRNPNDAESARRFQAVRSAWEAIRDRHGWAR